LGKRRTHPLIPSQEGNKSGCPLPRGEQKWVSPPKRGTGNGIAHHEGGSKDELSLPGRLSSEF